MPPSLPYDVQRAKGLPEEAYYTIGRAIQSALRFTKALGAESETSWHDWDVQSLGRGLFVLKDFQSQLDAADFRGNSDNYQLAEFVSILRHMASAVHGPMHLISCLDSNYTIKHLIVRSPEDSTEKIPITEELENIVDALLPTVGEFAKLFVAQAEEYGWRQHSDATFDLKGYSGHKLTGQSPIRLEHNLKGDEVEQAKYLRALMRIRRYLTDVGTRIDAYFTHDTSFDPSRKLDPQTLFQDGNISKLGIAEVHTFLDDINCRRMENDLRLAIEEYDNHIQRSKREIPELMKLRALIEGARVQLNYIAELHHLYMRHVNRATFPGARQILMGRLYSDENQYRIIRAISLSGYCCSHLVTMAKTLAQPTQIKV